MMDEELTDEEKADLDERFKEFMQDPAKEPFDFMKLAAQLVVAAMCAGFIFLIAFTIVWFAKLVL